MDVLIRWIGEDEEGEEMWEDSWEPLNNYTFPDARVYEFEGRRVKGAAYRKALTGQFWQGVAAQREPRPAAKKREPSKRARSAQPLLESVGQRKRTSTAQDGPTRGAEVTRARGEKREAEEGEGEAEEVSAGERRKRARIRRACARVRRDDEEGEMMDADAESEQWWSDGDFDLHAEDEMDDT